jgi:anti-sigma factor RsiW
MSDTAPFREPTCQELAELITDYLEGVLPAAQRALFDLHIAGCRDCTLYVEQMRTTVAVSGRIGAEDIPAEVQSELLAAFRTWAAETS